MLSTTLETNRNDNGMKRRSTCSNDTFPSLREPFNGSIENCLWNTFIFFFSNEMQSLQIMKYSTTNINDDK